MSKVLVGFMIVFCLVGIVYADSYTYTLVSDGNTTNTSDAIPVSGYLDKIEMSGPGSARTNQIVIATYDGTTAVETIATVSALTTPKVVRTRVLPTDNTGTALAAVGGTGTNTLTQLNVMYEKILVGGNIKVTTINAHANACTNKVVFYFEPLKK